MAGIGTIVIVLAVGGFIASRTASTRSSVGRSVVGDTPLAGGKAMSVQKAEELFPLAKYRPDSPTANDEQISGAWLRLENDPQLYITYETGVIATIRRAEDYQSTEVFAKAQLSDGVLGEIVDVDGTAVFAVRGGDVPESASVRFIVGEAVVVVVGSESVSEAELLQITDDVVSVAV